MTDDQVIHESPYADWYATQDASSRAVWICDKGSDRKVLVEPPTEWGRHWAWNVTEDGKAVCFRWERKPYAPETKVFSRLDGSSATILNRVGPHEYEVMTDDGIETWRDEDMQPADEE
jgi:hypothetical protein